MIMYDLASGDRMHSGFFVLTLKQQVRLLHLCRHTNVTVEDSPKRRVSSGVVRLHLHVDLRRSRVLILIKVHHLCATGKLWGRTGGCGHNIRIRHGIHRLSEDVGACNKNVASTCRTGASILVGIEREVSAIEASCDILVVLVSSCQACHHICIEVDIGHQDVRPCWTERGLIAIAVIIQPATGIPECFAENLVHFLEAFVRGTLGQRFETNLGHLRTIYQALKIYNLKEMYSAPLALFFHSRAGCLSGWSAKDLTLEH